MTGATQRRAGHVRRSSRRRGDGQRDRLPIQAADARRNRRSSQRTGCRNSSLEASPWPHARSQTPHDAAGLGGTTDRTTPSQSPMTWDFRICGAPHHELNRSSSPAPGTACDQRLLEKNGRDRTPPGPRPWSGWTLPVCPHPCFTQIGITQPVRPADNRVG